MTATGTSIKLRLVCTDGDWNLNQAKVSLYCQYMTATGTSIKLRLVCTVSMIIFLTGS